MNNELQLFHERVDDIPLLVGVMMKLGLSEVIDRTQGEHWLHERISNGWLTILWVAYILSEGDHRKSSVQEWVERHGLTLSRLLEQPLRKDVEANDDRLSILLTHLSDDTKWARLERALWAATVAAYELVETGVRLDSTTVSGYHTRHEDGLMQLGHSKDHRPDLAQVKLMAAAAEPTGQWIACDVVSGEQADDPLYTPLIQRVREIIGRRGVLYTGDCKMAALATRAELVQQGDSYVTSLPMTGAVSQQFDTWVAAAVSGDRVATLIWQEKTLLGAGYEFVRSMTSVIDDRPVTWNERVLVFRSLTLAQNQATALEERLQRAITDIEKLTPAPGRGKRQHTTEDSLVTAFQQALSRHKVEGLLTITYQKEEESNVQWVGRGGPNRETKTVTKVRYVITDVQRNQQAIRAQQDLLGWRILVTNLAEKQMSFSQTVCHYRNAPIMENTFHLLKGRPLGISPLYVRNDDQIRGLTRLLTLALRILTLIQAQIRQSLQRTGETLHGLYDGQPKRTTNQPTTSRMLKAVAHQEVTLTKVVVGQQVQWHLTPVPDLILNILRHLGLSPAAYMKLVDNSG
ncbi:MAG: IS1634 family transposase [Caldilinea sp.]